MTAEQKQALISACAERVRAMENYCTYEPQDTEAALDLSLVKIALAALTAQPVKLPKKEKALIGRDYLYVYCAGPVESAIRAAGYQVEGE